MSDIRKRTFSEILTKQKKFIVEHWAQITVAAGFLATILGFFTLYVYTNIIGRTELFIPSIDAKSALFIWLLLTLILIASYLIVLSATTWLFGCAVSQFNNIENDQGKITLFLLIPTTSGFAVFLAILFYKPSIFAAHYLIPILILTILSTYLLTYALTPFGKLVKKNQTFTNKKTHDRLKSKKLEEILTTPIRLKKTNKNKATNKAKNLKKIFLLLPLNRWAEYISRKSIQIFKIIEAFFYSKGKKFRTRRRVLYIIFSSFIILSTVAFSAMPTTLALRAYLGEETDDAINSIVSLSMFTLSLTLVPVFVFFFFSGDIFKRTRNGLIAVALVFLCFAITFKGALGQITYIAAGSLDIRQKTIEKYILNDDINLSDLNNTLWKTRSQNSKKLEIEAFQLFSFGDTLLLCPTDMLFLDYKEIRKYSAYCISTKNSKVTQKPRQFKFAKADKCPSNIFCRNGSWKGWEFLKESFENNNPQPSYRFITLKN